MKRFIFFFLLACTIEKVNAESINPPVPIQNEKWIFQTTDQWSSKLTQTTTMTVVGVLGNYVRMQYETHNFSASGQPAPTQTTQGTIPVDLNLVTTINGERLVSKVFDWPLSVGKKWSYRNKVQTSLNNPSGVTPAIYTTDTDAEVVKEEDVQTPAGTFKAIKIVYHNRTTLDVLPSFSSTSTNTIWYSPEVHRNVKFTSESFDASGQPMVSTVQLLVAHTQ